jgi:hypothetical protein
MENTQVPQNTTQNMQLYNTDGGSGADRGNERDSDSVNGFDRSGQNRYYPLLSQTSSFKDNANGNITGFASSGMLHFLFCGHAHVDYKDMREKL